MRLLWTVALLVGAAMIGAVWFVGRVALAAGQLLWLAGAAGWARAAKWYTSK